MQPIATAAFGAALDKAVGVDMLLSGNSALVSALAARSRAPHRRTKAIAAGSAAAQLGFVAGERLVSGRAVAHGFEGVGHASTTLVELAGAVGVVVVGTGLAWRKNARADAERG